MSQDINQQDVQPGMPIVQRPDAPTPGVPPASLECRADQLRVALHRMGKLAAVEAAVKAAPNPEMGIMWSYSPVFHSDNPLVVGMAQAVGVDAAGLRALFELAGSI